MTTETGPALSAAEWTGVLTHRDKLAAIREQLLDTPFSGHAVAALLLYDQPYGFTQEDVEDEVQVADYCDAMARERDAGGDHATAGTFKMLGERHRIRAQKIAALLPPPGVAPTDAAPRPPI